MNLVKQKTSKTSGYINTILHIVSMQTLKCLYKFVKLRIPFYLPTLACVESKYVLD